MFKYFRKLLEELVELRKATERTNLHLSRLEVAIDLNKEQVLEVGRKIAKVTGQADRGVAFLKTGGKYD